ncbi:MAG TPA: hypothetical protein VNF68_15075, partial [Candidatus Baltobacteraceae bacterium]|nr:hypothetical protein [Candidatus Baltobacteraceae bacterium]
LDRVGIPATFGRSRVKDDDWYGQMIEAYLLADRPLSERDLTSIADAVYAIVERFAVNRRISHRVKPLVSDAVIETLLSMDRLPDDDLGTIAPLMHERIIAALRASRAVLRADVAEIEERLSVQLNGFRRTAESKWLRPNVVDELRPEGKVRGYTYQGIKGLQFSGVAVVDLANGLLPHRSMLDLWDDARKLYVGLTRSRGFLAIHTPDRPGSKSMFYAIVMGEQSSEDVIGSPLPKSLQLLDQEQ